MTKQQILESTGLSEEEFYRQYPTQQAWEQATGGTYAKGGWIQKATASIKRRGTEGVCTGSNFGGPSCRPGTRRYALAKTFRKMAKARKKEEGGYVDYDEMPYAEGATVDALQLMGMPTPEMYYMGGPTDYEPSYGSGVRSMSTEYNRGFAYGGPIGPRSYDPGRALVNADGGYLDMNPYPYAYAYMNGGIIPIPMYKRGGWFKRFIKDVGAAAYGLGEGVLDTVSFGATDKLTDKGYKALQKIGGSSASEIRQQDSLRGYGNVGGAVGGAIINPGAVGSAIGEGAEGLGEGVSKGSPNSRFAQGVGKWAPTIGNIAGMAYGSLSKPDAGTLKKAGKFAQSGFGKFAGKAGKIGKMYNTYGGAAEGLVKSALGNKGSQADFSQGMPMGGMQQGMMGGMGNYGMMGGYGMPGGYGAMGPAAYEGFSGYSPSMMPGQGAGADMLGMSRRDMRQNLRSMGLRGREKRMAKRAWRRGDAGTLNQMFGGGYNPMQDANFMAMNNLNQMAGAYNTFRRELGGELDFQAPQLGPSTIPTSTSTPSSYAQSLPSSNFASPVAPTAKFNPAMKFMKNLKTKAITPFNEEDYMGYNEEAPEMNMAEGYEDFNYPYAMGGEINQYGFGGNLLTMGSPLYKAFGNSGRMRGLFAKASPLFNFIKRQRNFTSGSMNPMAPTGPQQQMPASNMQQMPMNNPQFNPNMNPQAAQQTMPQASGFAMGGAVNYPEGLQMYAEGSNMETSSQNMTLKQKNDAYIKARPVAKYTNLPPHPRNPNLIHPGGTITGSVDAEGKPVIINAERHEANWKLGNGGNFITMSNNKGPLSTKAAMKHYNGRDTLALAALFNNTEKRKAALEARQGMKYGGMVPRFEPGGFTGNEEPMSLMTPLGNNTIPLVLNPERMWTEEEWWKMPLEKPLNYGVPSKFEIPKWYEDTEDNPFSSAKGPLTGSGPYFDASNYMSNLFPYSSIKNESAPNYDIPGGIYPNQVPYAMEPLDAWKGLSASNPATNFSEYLNSLTPKSDDGSSAFARLGVDKDGNPISINPNMPLPYMPEGGSSITDDPEMYKKYLEGLEGDKSPWLSNALNFAGKNLPYLLNLAGVAGNFITGMKKAPEFPLDTNVPEFKVDTKLRGKFKPKLLSNKEMERLIKGQAAADRYAWTQRGARGGSAALTALSNATQRQLADSAERVANANAQLQNNADLQLLLGEVDLEKFNAMSNLQRQQLIKELQYKKIMGDAASQESRQASLMAGLTGLGQIGSDIMRMRMFRDYYDKNKGK